MCMCVRACMCVKERRKIELAVWGKKVPIALDGIRTCISGIRAHSASDCTTTAGTSRVSRMKHFRHSPVSSIAKQSCMKDSNSYLRDRDAKHLQGPPLSRTKRVKERRKIELTVWGKKVPIALDGMCVCVCVCVSQWKKVPDEWQARQATPAILQVSSSKHNAKKITTVCVCACVRACACLSLHGGAHALWIRIDLDMETWKNATQQHEPGLYFLEV